MELVDEAEDEADAVLAVLCGMGMSVGSGEDGAGDETGDTGVAFAFAGRTSAMSPLGSRVGTSWSPVPFALVKKIPFDCWTWILGAETSTCGRMCTCSWVVVGAGCTGWVCPGVLLLEFSTGPRHDAKCDINLRRTDASSPGNLPTSPAHSLNPARNLFSTLGSVAAAKATCCRCRDSKCFTVISRMSAFSSLECLAGCKHKNLQVF